MSIQTFHQFDPTLRYYGGQGCLVCGTNLGPQIDLGITDSIEGIIALCHDHARECGLNAGMVHADEVAAIQFEADHKLARVVELKAEGELVLEQARKERRATERVLDAIVNLTKPAVPKTIYDQPDKPPSKAKQKAVPFSGNGHQ